MPLCHHEMRPDVSVVIWVSCQLDQTRRCLQSLLQQDSQASFEVIVVNDAAGEGTRNWLANKTQGTAFKFLTNPKKLGFETCCNQGAELAEGRLLFFLDGKTEAGLHWLDPLVTTLDNDSAVGLTGGRKLYRDGTIASAGLVLENKGTEAHPRWLAEPFCQGLAAHSPLVARPLELQAVEGSGLMIRREIFTDLAGFQPDQNSQRQDISLCLRAIDAGWKIVYRPESMITVLAPPQKTAPPSQAPGVRTYTEKRLRRPHPNPQDRSVSVIVLTWNALEYTRLCAEALLQHTAPRHELIFVDNGSRPDTVKFLQELDRTHERVKIILNGENLGFAAGNNIGLAAATCQHACLLNSDTVVTEGWLENMLVHLEKNPHAGLIGPVTNSITGPQKLEKVTYDENTCDGLENFASQLIGALAGQCLESLWVVGFCVLIRDELLERLGGLDESFGQGNYEDTDYCLRAFVGGYQSLIAADSFVHHFGSRSFVDGKIDYAAALRDKHEIFRRKWNLPDDDQQNCSVNPVALKGLGFIPPLHFHPLPEVAIIGLWDWEKENWQRRGEAFQQAGRLDEAQRVFNRVRQLCPENNQPVLVGN